MDPTDPTHRGLFAPPERPRDPVLAARGWPDPPCRSEGFLPCMNCTGGCFYHDLPYDRETGHGRMPSEPWDEDGHGQATLSDPWEEEMVPEPLPAEIALNRDQRAAVEHGRGPALVVAGAGSGKTRVLVTRVRKLVDEGKVPASAILAVTFTRKAAGEMKQRLGADYRFKELTVSTFHGLALALCREHPSLVDRRGIFSVWDESIALAEVRRILREVWAEVVVPTGLVAGTRNSSGDMPSADAIHKFVGKWKRLAQPLSGKRFCTESTHAVHWATVTVVREYEALKRASNAMDFDDFIWRAVWMLEHHPELRDRMRERWPYLLVDEYQDTNDLQERFLRLLVGSSRNVMVVGDEDQCIPDGERVDVPGGSRPIEQMRVGDPICVSHDGRVRDSVVTRTSMTVKGTAFLFTTASGRTFRATAEHALFAAIGQPRGWYVYLMYRPGYGYRVGATQSTGTTGLKSMLVRTRQEHAERLWILGHYPSAAEAHVAEHTFAYRHGVPMAPFVPRPGTMFTDDTDARAFFTAFAANGLHLLDDVKQVFDRPAYVAKASRRDGAIAVNFVISMRDGHHVQVESQDIPESRRVPWGFTATKGGWRLRRLFKDVRVARGFAEGLASDIGGYVVERLSCPSADRRVQVVSAAGVFPGMLVPERQSDGSVALTEIVAREIVPVAVCRDLEVADAGNFLVNGVVVHNSIYAFNGANVDHILTFPRRFPGARVYTLGQNYRSSVAIVEAAARVIARNHGRRPKQIWTDNDPGWPVEYLKFTTPFTEAGHIAAMIDGSIKGGYAPAEHAILVRLRRQIPVVQLALLERKIPHHTVGYVELHQRADVKLLLAWMRCFVSPHDFVSGAICLRNWPKIGAGTVAQWQDACASNNDPVFYHLPFLLGLKGCGPKTQKGQSIVAFGETWREFERLARNGASILQLATWLYERTGLDTEIDEGKNADSQSVSLEAQRRDSFRTAFLASCPTEEASNPYDRITAFLDALTTNARRTGKEPTVRISTIHSAKGLEFDHVWIAGCVESVLPCHRNNDDDDEDDDDVVAAMKVGVVRDEIEEERRLMYVAMTRARHRLVLCHYECHQVRGVWEQTRPSRFLVEASSDPPASTTLREDPFGEVDESDEPEPVLLVEPDPRPWWQVMTPEEEAQARLSDDGADATPGPAERGTASLFTLT